MKYNKPEVVVLGSALGFVQSSGKPEVDVADIDLQQTSNAYESDE